MIGRLHELWRAQRGAAIIELAIVAPVIALMTVGVIDLSNGFSNKLRLEQAAQRSIEKVMQTTGVTSVETTIVNEAVCQVNGTNTDGTCKTAPITAANVAVEHLLYCNAAADPIDAEDCATGETESRWVRVTITSVHEPLFPLRFSGADSDGNYQIAASAGIRTE